MIEFMYNASRCEKENPSLGTVAVKNNSLPRPAEPLCLAGRWPAGPLGCADPPSTPGSPGRAWTSRLGRLLVRWKARRGPPPQRVPPPPPLEQRLRGAPSGRRGGLSPPPPHAAHERRRLLRLVPPPRPGGPPLLLRGTAAPGPRQGAGPSCTRRGQHGRTG